MCVREGETEAEKRVIPRDRNRRAAACPLSQRRKKLKFYWKNKERYNKQEIRKKRKCNDLS